MTHKPSLTALLAAVALIGTLSGTANAAQQPSDTVAPPAGMLRYPDVSQTHIVFSYANDLWLVDRQGGVATPLASPPGQELFPRFDDSGSRIVFQGNYEGNRDLYVMSVAGGVPQRVTHHPSSEIPCSWTPDGRLVFFRNGQSGIARQQTLFTVSPEGGLPEPLPVPYGAWGTISPDGDWLAYTPYTRDTRTWKRYVGGMATDIWMFNLKAKAAAKVTRWEGTDTQPMWNGQTLYYLSDDGPQHRLNIWKVDFRSGRREQVTHFEDNDIRWPSIGPGANGSGEIVFQLGTKLHLLDLASGRSRAVEIRVPGERGNLRPKMVDANKNIQAWDISPSGKRAVVQARGDIWTLPAKRGAARNLNRSNAVAERSPAWSPDGRWLAYFSDASGEYEVHLRQSDGKGEERQLTSGGGLFKMAMAWSPDSKKLAVMDKGARLSVVDVESGESQQIDESPFGGIGGQMSMPSWSKDSRWLAYSRSREDTPVSAIFLYDLENKERHQVTRGMFNDRGPVFDRNGDWLFFSSNRNFSPTYADNDTTFIYQSTGSLLAVPLRADMKSPWAPESDEESFDGDEEEEKEEAEDPGEDQEDDSDNGDEPEQSGADDGISGTWEGLLTGPDFPPQGVPMTAELSLSSDGSLEGSFIIPTGSASILEGRYDKAAGTIQATVQADDGTLIEVEASVQNGSMEGVASIAAAGLQYEFNLTRSSKGGGGDAQAEDSDNGDKNDKKKKKEDKPITIDLEGFESRALLLPVPAGRFFNLSVNDKNQLLYVRLPSSGAGPPAIKLFDLKDEKKAEQTVASGSMNYAMSANGKKILVVKGPRASIQNASAGGKAEAVPVSGMLVRIDPQQEWGQLLQDAWRIMRDFFYDPTMHGVDWPGVLTHYQAMLPHCASREDVNFLIAEMISELNVGHAYLMGRGDGESQPSLSVGMLGVDYEIHEGAYRIAKIYQGGPWDSDARGPLSQPGVDVKEGNYLLAVNGVPMDPSKDPWSAFLGKANQLVTLTVSEKAVLDDEAREVTVKTLSNEMGLRYRAWVEHNRARVEKESGGRVGYIHVPDTGINGQNNLYRQLLGQLGSEALIIDERWNGGGQIPTRFIEMLNRPVTNYWAGREGRDIHWPPDSHQGPKCMLINGLAGSGGDAFPAYFRQAGLGKLIGTRTWGGLVGISGNPSLIDGGSVSAPTFAFYEKDGTWGIEGYGVPPDIEVVDDPALMIDGGDPQLQVAVEHMLEELRTKAYRPPARPAYPNRSGLGITEQDK
ncbi:MAG: peptidase S41 [Planctomycetota bacterium]|nr:MAG: peptidase S41 [Planctomycetota bacterium]